MSQDITPRPGDLPAEPARPNQTATTANYSAKSPADRPTAVPAAGQAPRALQAPAGQVPASGQPPRPGQVPQHGQHQVGGQAWSQDMSRDTGPVGQPGSQDRAWWEPRPSGAWATPSWGSSTPRPGQPGAPTGTHGTQVFPGPTASGAGYPGPGYGTATMNRPPAEQAPAPAKGRRMTVVVATTAVLALLAGFGGGVVGAQLTSGSANSADSSLSQLTTSAPVSDRSPAPAGSVEEVASKVLPSTVSVLASSNQSSGEGSGIILTADGLILTNNHVVEGATAIEVRFNDGTTATAQVVGTTVTDDLAVLKADGVSGLTPAVLGSSSDLAVGQPVVAIGSPLGLSATVTSGIVSALNRPVRTASSEPSASGQSQDTVINAVQTDAAINPGNSGGALVDMSGAVIGINSAIASLSSSADGSQAGSIGVGFAIPIDQAKRIAQEIIDTGKASHAVLGASVSDATDRSSQIPTGAEIAQITPGGGAEAAGLQVGDVITKIGTQNVESADALIAAVRSSTPNGTAEVTYVRDGETQTVTVTLGSATAN